MADDELPSFSLGLDSDSDTAPPSPVLEPRDLDPGSASDGDFDRLAEVGRETDLDVPRSLRRLRRGLPDRSCPNPNGEDDIEEFSSEEEVVTVEKPSVQYQSVCSSTKLPLSRHGDITSLPSRKLSTINRKQPSEDAASVTQRTSRSEVFQKPLVSPLRKFLLVDSDSDSDSDGPSISGRVNKEVNGSDISSKSKIESESNQKKDDLWKDFQPMNSFRIATPVLDEVCNEYFHSLKSKSQTQPKQVETIRDDGNEESVHHQLGLTNPLPPSHRYFFHNDQRVQNLVRSRLPYFVPLGNARNREIMQRNASVIDYMSQFNNGETSKSQLNQKAAPKKRPRAQSTSRSITQETTSMDWVNPRSSASTVTKNAGKRRVHANGKSAGRWYTGPDGRKVYVASNGQELSGQSAYRHYRKESGTGLKKSKKKPKANKRAKK